jgi:hypothetical protein
MGQEKEKLTKLTLDRQKFRDETGVVLPEINTLDYIAKLRAKGKRRKLAKKRLK